MNNRLIENWHRKVWLLWSARVALFWIIVGTFVMVAPLMSDELKSVLGSWRFGGILFVAGVSFGLARFLKQPGTQE
jgi:hypothetical protein